MASKLTDFTSLRQSIEVPDGDVLLNNGATHSTSYDRPSELRMRSEEHERATEAGQPPTHDNCDDHHHVGSDPTITLSSSSKLAGQTVAPFLAKHIPEQYAPLGKQTQPISSLQKDPNTKYCYRHQPDSKCRRTADEPTMENLQRNLETLSQADQQGISHVWSLFSAAPAKHRNLMLQGILTQCCFPQLSYLSNAVRDLIRIDFFTALPNEISFKILSHLDTTSLCKAAQVSQRWRKLADDDLVWHKMCEQHIDRKCTKCGWGLPLLERRRLRDWKRQQQLRGVGRGLNEWSPNLTPMPEDVTSTEMVRTSSNGSIKRDITSFLADEVVSSNVDDAKRPCTNGINGERSVTLAQPKFRPWKEVYKDRFKVGTNWKYGRYSTKVFRGHTNGIMCLQFDDNILATGSYDNTIKIWDINTGECLRTLRGHTVGVRALQFDDTKLISGSLDKKVKVWNWRTGECISTYDGGSMGIISVNFEGNLLASGSIDKSVKVWNFEDKSTFCLRGHKDWVNAVRVDAESRTVFSASDDCTVRLWDLDTRRTIRIFEGHVGQVQQVILLPAEYEPEDPDAYEEIDDAASTTHSQTSDQHSPPPPENTNTFADWPASRHRPAKYILTGGLDSTIRLWCVETGRCLKTFFGHVEGIWALAGDTLRFVSGAEDRMVKVWDARSGKCERTITGHAGPVTCLGLSDSRLVSGSEDCEVRVLDFRTEQAGETNTATVSCNANGNVNTAAVTNGNGTPAV